MPLCKSCGRFGNVLSIEPCPYCGTKDWVPPESTHDKVMREHGEKYRKMTPAQRADKDRSGGGCLLALVLLVGGLAVLWLLVAVIKWMWQHS
jgi:hypothetical protein